MRCPRMHYQKWYVARRGCKYIGLRPPTLGHHSKGQKFGYRYVTVPGNRIPIDFQGTSTASPPAFDDDNRLRFPAGVQLRRKLLDCSKSFTLLMNGSGTR